MAVRGGVAVGVDVGGTKLAAGLIAPGGAVLDRSRHTTPADGDAIVDLIAACADDFEQRHDLTAVPVGVGAAGLIDRDGAVRFAPNIAWTRYPLRSALADRLGRAVTVDNDANVAAWGEYLAGAARGAGESMVMLTVGTGVGGGVVLQDELVRGAGGMAGELGHMAVLEGGPACPCGASGCLEAMSSGSAIARQAREAVAAGRVSSDSPLGSTPVESLTGKTVTLAAYAGDAEAIAVLATAGRWLGVGIASLLAAFDPQIVVVGGGAMEAGELLLGPARDAAYDRLLGRGHRTPAPIVAAQLGDDAGLVGAALLALAATVP